MAHEGRAIILRDDDFNILVIFFSITDDYLPYAKKHTWEYMAHNPKGKICFIEKMIAKKWNKEIRKRVEEFIVRNYPSVEDAVWYRTKGLTNHKVTVRRICTI